MDLHCAQIPGNHFRYNGTSTGIYLGTIPRKSGEAVPFVVRYNRKEKNSAHPSIIFGTMNLFCWVKSHGTTGKEFCTVLKYPGIIFGTMIPSYLGTIPRKSGEAVPLVGYNRTVLREKNSALCQIPGYHFRYNDTSTGTYLGTTPHGTTVGSYQMQLPTKCVRSKLRTLNSYGIFMFIMFYSYKFD